MTCRRFSPPQGFGQLGSEFSPTNPDELFVSDAHTAAGGAAFPGLVSSFTDAADGTPLRWERRSPTTAAPPAGLRLATTAASSSSSTRPRPRSPATRSAPAALLTFLQSTGAGQIGAGAEDARLSPDGSTLWVVESGGDSVTGFTVDGGTLTPLAAADGPAGATPSGIVVTCSYRLRRAFRCEPRAPA
jgi:DNA-binding beta-propeller fold protein YncE